MNESPLVSIIVPVYNVETYVCQCLESVASQTYKCIEAIVIDDGSTDGSNGLCDDFAMRDSRFRVIHTDNRGLAAARNVGIEEARGAYLVFVDGDDRIAPSMVGKLVNCAEAYGALISMCDYLRIVNDECRTMDSFPDGFGPLIDERQYWLGNPTHDTAAFTVVWNKLWRRELFDHVRFSEGILYEDTVIELDLIAGNCPIAVVDEPLYLYRADRPGSITSSRIPGAQIEACQALIMRDAYFSVQGWNDIRAVNLGRLVGRLMYVYRQLDEISYERQGLYVDCRRKVRRLFWEIAPFILVRPKIALSVSSYLIDERLREFLLFLREQLL